MGRSGRRRSRTLPGERQVPEDEPQESLSAGCDQVTALCHLDTFPTLLFSGYLTF